MQDVPYQATAEISQMMARQWNIEKNREYSSLRLVIFLPPPLPPPPQDFDLMLIDKIADYNKYISVCTL